MTWRTILFIVARPSAAPNRRLDMDYIIENLFLFHGDAHGPALDGFARDPTRSVDPSASIQIPVHSDSDFDNI